VVVAAAAEIAPRPRARRALLPAVALAAVFAIALTPPGDAIARWVRDLVGTESHAPPAPKPVLASLPAAGRLLVAGPSGAWVVSSDGSRRRLGAYDDLEWSPQGLFVAATTGDELRALEPDGTVRWVLPRAGGIDDPRWAPSGYRIAYRTATEERVVAGDGSGDHPLVDGVAELAPAWRPGSQHQLALARANGTVELWAADTSRRLWRAGGAPPVALGWMVRRLVVVRPAEIETFSAGGRVVRRDRVAVSVGAENGGGERGGGAGGHGGPLTAAAFSPDGRTVALAQGSLVSTVVAGQRRVRLTAAGPVSGLAFSPDGSRLLVASDAAEQWVFLPLGGGRVSAVTVRGFPRIGPWCCAH
jgi:hypothetical protein